MYEFIDKLIKIVFPRTRDFKGIPLKSIDKWGNLTIGFKEYTPFPEAVLDREKGIFGLEITIVTTAKTKEEAKRLLELLGLPLRKEK